MGEQISYSLLALYAAFAVSLVGVLASLVLSIVLKLKACPLCVYQRTFLIAVMHILGAWFLFPRFSSEDMCLLALPMAIAGLCVAARHSYLELNGILECPPGFFGLRYVPLQSAAVFLIVVSLLAVHAAVSGWSAGELLGVFAVGMGFGAVALASAPTLPPAPQQPYSLAPDTCRPAFKLG